MIMKLTGLRDLAGATTDPKGFGHDSISKKMRLMQKKMFDLNRKHQNILPFQEL